MKILEPSEHLGQRLVHHVWNIGEPDLVKEAVLFTFHSKVLRVECDEGCGLVLQAVEALHCCDSAVEEPARSRLALNLSIRNHGG